MTDAWIVSPFYLEKQVSRLVDIAPEGAEVQEPDLGSGDTQDKLSRVLGPVASSVSAAALRGVRPVVMSGDCCVTIGVMAGLQRAGVDATLLWFDAHGDFNTWETSPSGFLGGMPFAMIVGRGEQRMPKAVGLEPLNETRAVLVDGRDLDPQERVALEGSAVRHVTDIQALLSDPVPDGPLYVHFDTDILPAEDAPAMNYPVPGGPSASVVSAVFRRLAETGRVVAASMSAWNPDLDEDRSTERVCLDVFAALMDPDPIKRK